MVGALVFQDEDLMKKVRGVLHYLGGTMDPHQAWLVHRGVRTLAMRVRKAQHNAQALADKLGLQVWSLSLSHSASAAVAVVVALGEKG